MNVPHLTTALIGPLPQLEKHFLMHQVAIESWFRKQWQHIAPPIYSSVDIRNAGFKVAPVDTNLFPAGFNNLNPDFLPLCVQATQFTMEKIYPKCSRILIIPENHTRNIFYFESVATLQTIFENAGFETRIASLLPEIKKATKIELPSRRSLLLEPMIKQGNRLGVENFDACLVLLNNDLSQGIPDILKDIEQPIIPPLHMGWFHRSKTQHFSHYQDIAHQFAQFIDIDPWLINPLFQNCNEVDFQKQEGEECLITLTTQLFETIRKKYNEYNVTQKPFIVIKADKGTYGMGILIITDPDEIKNLSRKERTRMSATKGGQPIHEVIIQEGVYTFETFGEEQEVAEPVIYMMGQRVVGGFYRVHKEKGPNENLNSPGMHFEPLAFAHHCNIPNPHRPECQENRFYAYGVIARLASLAAAKETVSTLGA